MKLSVHPSPVSVNVHPDLQTHKDLCSLVASTWFGWAFQLSISVAGPASLHHQYTPRTPPREEMRIDVR